MISGFGMLLQAAEVIEEKRLCAPIEDVDVGVAEVRCRVIDVEMISRISKEVTTETELNDLVGRYFGRLGDLHLQKQYFEYSCIFLESAELSLYQRRLLVEKGELIRAIFAVIRQKREAGLRKIKMIWASSITIMGEKGAACERAYYKYRCLVPLREWPETERALWISGNKDICEEFGMKE